MKSYKGNLTFKTEVRIHSLFWILTIYFTFVGNPFYFEFPSPDLFYTTYVFIFLSTFYFHYVIIMKRIFNAFKWPKLFTYLFISCLFFTGLRYFVEQVFTQFFFGISNYSNVKPLNYLVDNLTYSSKPIILSSFLWLIIYIIRLLEYNKKILEEQKNIEIKFLKAQINPHFIFNTLNNIYSMVHFKSPKALTSIEKLSQIMRFTTYEAQKSLIKLSEEINYIKAYIELETLRHYEDSFVKMDINIDDTEVQIPPYLLSPLVENALKHGKYTIENPIEISLSCNEQKLIFEIKNEIGKQKKDKLGGIGLINLENRLEILFPLKHLLISETRNNIFYVKLEIQMI